MAPMAENGKTLTSDSLAKNLQAKFYSVILHSHQVRVRRKILPTTKE
jgi:hypothetical protein